ncbi:hypothetical protein BAC1_01517 [uncultured bacterium]|nr:hypothetical protein BAC1_01517 [uncultured bacterium]
MFYFKKLILNGGCRVASVSVICILLFAITGCGLSNQVRPTSLGEEVSGYTYIPIDPTKVQIETGKCTINYSDIGDDLKTKKVKLLDMLPDNAVRMSMESSDSKGNVTYGVSKAGKAGSAYKLTADYVNSDTVNKSVLIQKTVLVKYVSNTRDSNDGTFRNERKTERKPALLLGNELYIENETYVVNGLQWDKPYLGLKAEKREIVPGSEQYNVKSSENLTIVEREALTKNGYEEFNVPIYVGIGLRIVAEGVSTSRDATISGIGVIGAEAEAKRLMGSLTVQTLGVNSQAVASALPVQSELSRTTAENAFVAIGSIKAMLHQPETIKFPRVVGLYLPFSGGKLLVNALISELSRKPVTWCPNGYDKDNSDNSSVISQNKQE